MTVTTTTNRISYTGDGASTVFAVPFLFLANADIDVYVNGIEATTGFVTTGAGLGAGNVTFTAAPALNATVVLVRNPDTLQNTALPSNGPFPSTSVERMSDKSMIGVQRLADQIDRTLILSDGDAAADMTLPLAADRAGKALVFNEDGDVDVSADIAAQVAAAAQSAVDAEASRDAIDNRIYPGTYTGTHPTTRPDGTAIQEGDRHFFTDDDNEYIYRSGAWVNFEADAAASAAEAAVQAGLAATSKTGADTSAATATAKALEAANYAAAAATGAKFYDTDVLGRAAVADGATFGVKAGGTIAGSTVTRPYVVRRDTAGTQTVLYSVLPASEVDGTTATVQGQYPLIYSTSSGSAAGVTISEVFTAGRLNRIGYKANGAGTISLLKLTKSGSNFTVVSTTALPAAVLGNNIATAADFGVIDVAVGDWVGLLLGTATIASGANRSLTKWSRAGTPTGTQAWTSTANSDWHGWIETTVPNVALAKTQTAAAVQSTLTNSEAIMGARSFTYGTYPLIVGTTQIGLSTAAKVGGGVAGTLTEVGANVNVAGSIDLLICRDRGSNSIEINERVTLGSAAVGDNVWTSANFGTLTLASDQFVALQASAGGGQVGFSTVFSGESLLSRAAATGNITTWTSTASRKLMAYAKIAATSAPNVARTQFATAVVDEMDGVQTAIGLAHYKHPRTLYDIGFSASTPADWTIPVAWTKQASGLLSPVGAADWSQRAFETSAVGPSNERSTRRFRFSPQATGVQFAAGTWRNAGTAVKATVVQVDDVNHLLKIHDAGSTWAAAPALTVSAVLAALVGGDEYELAIVRVQRTITATVTSLTTGVVMGTVTYRTTTSTAEPQCGEVVGSLSITNITGQTLFLGACTQAHVGDPHVMFITDSIGAGYLNALTDRWTQLASDALRGDVAINAISGAKSEEFAGLLSYVIPKQAPKHIVICMGTNDGTAGLATFQTNVDALVAYCAANSTGMGVCTIGPTNSAGFGTLNTYLLGLATAVRKIRFDRALTTGRDGTTWDASLHADTGSHPNTAGNLALYNELRRAYPELFTPS